MNMCPQTHKQCFKVRLLNLVANIRQCVVWTIQGGTLKNLKNKTSVEDALGTTILTVTKYTVQQKISGTNSLQSLNNMARRCHAVHLRNYLFKCIGWTNI